LTFNDDVYIIVIAERRSFWPLSLQIGNTKYEPFSFPVILIWRIMGFRIFTFMSLLLTFGYAAHADCEYDIPTDFNGDCKVDYQDLEVIAIGWLESVDSHEWSVRYDGPQSNTDQPKSIAVDKINVYVTGASYSFGTDYDYTTVKYSPDNKQPVWVAGYDGPGSGKDEPYDIVIDSNSNIYVAGRSTGDGTSSDYAIIKYHPDSNLPVWVARYDGPASSNDIAYSAAVDSKGNIYVTGHSVGIGDNVDCATIKYSSDSNLPVWVARYDGPAKGMDAGYGIAVDSNDNIYVAGTSAGQDTSYDFITIKYTADSNLPVWVARYDGAGSDIDMGTAIAINDEGNIFTTGISTGLNTFLDYTTIKYQPDSNQPVWVATYNGRADGNDIAYDAAVDSIGNIYVTGRSDSGPPSKHDYATVKYSTDSNQPVWVATYSGQDDNYDTGWEIEIDENDNIYVTGDSFASETSTDYVTIKYGSEANEPIWIAHYPTVVEAGIDAYQGRAMVIDPNNKIYVTVPDAASGTFNDFLILRYSASLTCTTDLGGDLDNNCRVDFADYAVLAGFWLEDSTKPETPTEPDPDPEPEPNEPGKSGTPYVSTRKPHISTRKPHVSTRKPHVSTRTPHVSTRKPNMPDPNDS
jgi:uncharacterized delta-60 repeat protein